MCLVQPTLLALAFALFTFRFRAAVSACNVRTKFCKRLIASALLGQRDSEFAVGNGGVRCGEYGAAECSLGALEVATFQQAFAFIQKRLDRGRVHCCLRPGTSTSRRESLFTRCESGPTQIRVP